MQLITPPIPTSEDLPLACRRPLPWYHRGVRAKIRGYQTNPQKVIACTSIQQQQAPTYALRNYNNLAQLEHVITIHNMSSIHPSIHPVIYPSPQPLPGTSTLHASWAVRRGEHRRPENVATTSLVWSSTYRNPLKYAQILHI